MIPYRFAILQISIPGLQTPSKPNIAINGFSLFNWTPLNIMEQKCTYWFQFRRWVCPMAHLCAHLWSSTRNTDFSQCFLLLEKNASKGAGVATCHSWAKVFSKDHLLHFNTLQCCNWNRWSYSQLTEANHFRVKITKSLLTEASFASDLGKFGSFCFFLNLHG